MGEALGVTPSDAAAAEWLRAAARGFFESIYNAEVASARGVDHVELTAAADRMANAAKNALWDEVDKTFAEIRGLVPDFPFAVVSWVLTQVLGITISADQIKTVMTGSPTDADRIALGSTLTTLYRETLPTEAVAAGFRAREAGAAEFTNFERLSGAAMRLQIADLVLDWLGRKIPFGLGDILQDLADLMNTAIALDDALEEVVQVPMQAVIQRGMEAYYNRQIKPADLSATEALQARIADKITDSDLTKILDNAGYRDDIRQILRDNAAKNLTESDINDLYQWNLWSRDQVKEQYKQLFYEEDDRELKTKLVEMTRRQKLREKIFELYGNLYRDGVATKQEVTPFLENYGYDADEVEMWFSVQELERRQRKWMSDATLLKLVKQEVFTISAAIDYLTLQGMTVNDATAYLTLAIQAEQEQEVKELEREAKAAIAKLPKAVRDKCDDLLKPEDILSELLARLIGLIPGDLGVIPGAAKLKSYIECAIKAILTP